MSSALQMQELFKGQTRLLDDGAECALGKVSSWMVRNDCAAATDGIIPDLVAPLRVAVKDKAGFAQSSDDVSRPERGESCHDSTGTGTVNEIFARRFFPKEIRESSRGRGSLCSRQDSMSFRATSSAISNVSATVRPCATSPWRIGLVARYCPSFKRATVIGTRYSDMVPMSIAESQGSRQRQGLEEHR